MLELLRLPMRGMTLPLHRVLLVGSAGAGKRTVARRVAFRCGARLLEDAVLPPRGGGDKVVAIASHHLQGAEGAAFVRAWSMDGHGAVVWLDPPPREIRARIKHEVRKCEHNCDPKWLACVSDVRIPGSPSTDECVGVICALLADVADRDPPPPQSAYIHFVDMSPAVCAVPGMPFRL